MPSAAFHSNYWAGSADAPAAAPATVASYPLWQTTITVHSAAGSMGAQVFQAIYEQWRLARTTTQVRHHGHD